MNLFALKHWSLPKVLTMHPFLGVGLLLGLFLGQPSISVAQARQCQELFQTSVPALIAMNPTYRGEELGLYIDPVTKVPWKVHYFTEAERAPYELFIRNGNLVHKDGEKAQSPYDHESMSWENGLLVIDPDFRIFLLPFEQRGLYHHSSLTGGKDILFAGTAAFHNGVIRELSDRSGHYKPNSEQTRAALRELASKGVDMRQIRLTGYFLKELTNNISLSPREVPQVFPELFAPSK